MWRRAVVAAGVVGVVGLVVVGQPGVAAGAPEKRPREAACRYHDPKLTNLRLSAAVAAKETWPQQRLRYADALRYGRGAGVTVAVVDSGVDGTHEQLRGRVRPGYDVTSGRLTPGGNTDCAAHGTRVAGIIAAQPIAGRAMVGIAPDAVILPIRQTWGVDDNGQAAQGSAANLLAAMRVALAAHVQVVNVSVTVPASQLSPAAREQFAQVARDAARGNVVIVAATGNRDEYGNQNVVTYPAALAADFDSVIAVGGITNDGKVDAQSITGPFVTVAAPDRGMPCPMPGGGLVPCDGTSFAAPFVAGLAALLRSRDRTITAAEVKRRIELTADHPSTDLPSDDVGYGVINPLAAMTAVLPTSHRSTAAASPPLAPPPAPDRRTRAIAVAVAAGATLAALLIVGAAMIIPRGRRRRWRPGQPLRGE